MSNPVSDNDVEWVYVLNTKDFTEYYKPTSVMIDKQNKIINVWTKSVFTDKGKSEFLLKWSKIGNRKYNDINHQLILRIFNYKEWKSMSIHIMYVSKSGNVLWDGEGPPKWVNIQPDTVIHFFISQLLEDYNINR